MTVAAALKSSPRSRQGRKEDLEHEFELLTSPDGPDHVHPGVVQPDLRESQTEWLTELF